MSSARTMYKMQITKIIDHTKNIRELYLKTLEPSQFVFKAGQFVTLHVPQEPKPAMRAYSIASSELDNHGLKLIFKFVEGGVASNFIWSLKGEETLNFTGPFGRVFFREPPSEQIVFINTGSGVSQHVCYLQSKLTQFPHLKYRMLFGVRNEADVYYQQELNELAAALKDFKFEYVLSRPSESWTGKKGYVQHFMKETHYQEIDNTFYLCGNSGMIKEVKEILMGENFDKSKIFAEAFD